MTYTIKDELLEVYLTYLRKLESKEFYETTKDRLEKNLDFTFQILFESVANIINQMCFIEYKYERSKYLDRTDTEKHLCKKISEYLNDKIDKTNFHYFLEDTKSHRISKELKLIISKYLIDHYYRERTEIKNQEFIAKMLQRLKKRLNVIEHRELTQEQILEYQSSNTRQTTSYEVRTKFSKQFIKSFERYNQIDEDTKKINDEF